MFTVQFPKEMPKFILNFDAEQQSEQGRWKVPLKAAAFPRWMIT